MIFTRRNRSRAKSAPANHYEFTENLRSVEDSLAFFATVRLTWSEVAEIDPHLAECHAAQYVLSAVEGITASASVLQTARTEHEANLSLSRKLPVIVAGVQLRSARVALRPHHEAVQAAEKMRDERQTQRADAMYHDRLRRQIQFLRTEALRDPASARIYWLIRNPQNPDPLPSSEVLDDLVRQAATWRNDNPWVLVAQLLHEFIKDLPDHRRDRLVEQLGRVFLEYGRHDLAARVPILHTEHSDPLSGPAA